MLKSKSSKLFFYCSCSQKGESELNEQLQTRTHQAYKHNQIYNTHYTRNRQGEALTIFLRMKITGSEGNL